MSECVKKTPTANSMKASSRLAATAGVFSRVGPCRTTPPARAETSTGAKARIHVGLTVVIETGDCSGGAVDSTLATGNALETMAHIEADASQITCDAIDDRSFAPIATPKVLVPVDSVTKVTAKAPKKSASSIRKAARSEASRKKNPTVSTANTAAFPSQSPSPIRVKV